MQGRNLFGREPVFQGDMLTLRYFGGFALRTRERFCNYTVQLLGGHSTPNPAILVLGVLERELQGVEGGEVPDRSKTTGTQIVRQC